MPASKAQQRAVSKYMKENYDVFQIRMPKGRKAEPQAHAQYQGESLNGFISRAIDGQIERNMSPQPTGTPVGTANPLEEYPLTHSEPHRRRQRRTARVSHHSCPALLTWK